MKDYESLEHLFSLVREPVIGAVDGKIVLMNRSASALLHDRIGEDVSELLPEYLTELPDDAPATMGTVGRLHCAVTSATVGDVRLYVLSNHSEEELGAGMSTDTASCLNALMTYRLALERLRDEVDLHPDCAATLSMLSSSYYRLLRVLYNSGTARLLEEGRACFSPVELNLSELCGNLVVTTGMFARKRGVELTFYCPERIIVAKADRKLIEVMTMCLLANALFHTRGGGSIHVRLTRDGEFAELTVSDSGTKTPPELTAAPGETGGRLPTFEECAGLDLNLKLATLIAERHDGGAHLIFDTGAGTRVCANLRLFNPGREKFEGTDLGYSMESMDVIFTELSCVLNSSDYDIRLLD